MVIDGLCRRYGCLPSALLAEDVSILPLVELLELAKPERTPELG